MGSAVSIDGVLIDADAAVIPVMDRGFLYGDSAFEVLRTYGGRPFEMAAHLERLRRSCESLAIPLEISDDALGDEVEQALVRSGNADSYVRIIVTRGVTALGLVPDGPTASRRIVVVMPVPAQPADLYEKGRTLLTVSAARSLDQTGAAGAKASNYLPNILSTAKAKERGAYEALSVAMSGEVLEGATSNVFLVRGGEILTPPLALGILDGITRRVVFRCAQDAGIAIAERLLFPPDLYRAEELFITSSIREVVPIVAVDGVIIGDGCPGALTRRMHEAFRAVTAR